MRVPIVRDRASFSLDQALTPMIDVIFLLLIFFVWTSNFHAVEYLLPGPSSRTPGTNPSATTEPPPDAEFDDVVVRLRTANGALALEVNGSPMESEEATTAFLRSLAALKADAPVILHPDPDVAVKHVIRLYDLARTAGFEAVEFAVNEDR